MSEEDFSHIRKQQQKYLLELFIPSILKLYTFD